jgi:hypothetical protein
MPGAHEVCPHHAHRARQTRDHEHGIEHGIEHRRVVRRKDQTAPFDSHHVEGIRIDAHEAEPLRAHSVITDAIGDTSPAPDAK